MKHLDLLDNIATADAAALRAKALTYGDSWMRRGGVGAYMVAIRKADRIEHQCAARGYDVFAALRADGGAPDGLLDDIRDLRRYLMLWEAEARVRGLLRDDDPIPQD